DPRCPPGDHLHGAVRAAHRGPTAGVGIDASSASADPARAVAIYHQELPGAGHLWSSTLAPLAM
ncbi:MAG: hypothetical protein WA488_18935, partial [Mycobacterium sp.]|uniref:hypothetical protein n=1 Tax=Mycobacterium sp. TaxID=1785 RepID=UPI003CA8C672